MRTTVFLLVMLAGCQRISAPLESGDKGSTGPAVNVAQSNGNTAQKPALGGLGRRMQLPEVQNYMRNLGVAYKNFEAFNNRGPRNLEELAPQFENHPKMVEALKNGWWVFIYSANRQQMSAGPSNTVIAYEAQADGNNMRVVVMGDGTIRMLDENTFKKTPRAGK